MKKRILAYLMSLTILVGILPAASAAGGEEIAQTLPDDPTAGATTIYVSNDGTESGTGETSESPIKFREAIAKINGTTTQSAEAPQKFIISLTEDVIDTSSGNFSLEKNITTIQGNGHTITISGITSKTEAVLHLGLQDGTDRLTITQYDQPAANVSVNAYIGGTVYMYDGVSIVGNTVAYGQGIQVNGGTFYMYGGAVKDFHTPQPGAGVSITAGKFCMYGGEITNCKANMSGGAFFIQHSTSYGDSAELYIWGGTISQNQSSKRGGAIAVYQGKAEIKGEVEITENNAPLGGAIYVQNANSSLTIEGTEENPIQINNNKGTGAAGGAVCVLNLAESNAFSIKNAVLSGNSSAGSGGAIYVQQSPATIENCSFTNNSAVEGGAIASNTNTIQISTCDFTSNKAESDDSDGGGYGGAILVQDKSAAIKDCHITDNCADVEGGGIYVAGTNADAPTDLTLGGNLVIQNNTAGEAAAAGNLHISQAVTTNEQEEVTGSKQITVQVDGLTNSGEPQIGISMDEGQAGVFTSGYKTEEAETTEHPNTYFFSDDSSYLVTWNEGKTEARLAEGITITPADITVYMGTGDEHGYDGIVNSQGQIETTNTMPEPGYYITLPDSLNASLGGDNAADLCDVLTIEYRDGSSETSKQWKLMPYGTEDHSASTVTVDGVERDRYIYKLEPVADGQDPVRVQITNSEGETVTSDQFTPSMEHQSETYTMQIYRGDQALENFVVKVKADGAENEATEYALAVGTGTLTVRARQNDTVTDIVTDEVQVSGGEVTAVASGVTYYVNDSEVELTDVSGVHLLVDEVLEGGAAELENYIKSSMQESIPTTDGYAFIHKYLDLVDTNNGNAYVTIGADQSMDVYWPVPDDYKSGGSAYIVHFGALDRGDYTDINAALSGEAPTVEKLEAPVTIGGTQYFKFETGSFSPFTLVYEKDTGGGGGTGGTTRYTITANAGEGGSITPSGSVRVSRGSDKTFTITAGEGYVVADVLVDGKSVGAVSSYTFENVRGNHAIEAHYEKENQVADPDDTGVSGWLNTRDHLAYLNGYDTGAFGPDNNMTRAEAAQMFYNLLLDKDVPITVSFSDVAPDAWYAKAVHTLGSLSIIQGVGDNQFAPDRAITRAEFTVIAMRFANLDTSGENIFTDVSENDWFYEQVVGSIQYGWITGYEDGTFRPYNTITRAEVTAIVDRMLGRAADTDYVDSHADELRQFPDVDKTNWAYYNIMEATNAHDYTKSSGTETWTNVTD